MTFRGSATIPFADVTEIVDSYVVIQVIAVFSPLRNGPPVSCHLAMI